MCPVVVELIYRDLVVSTRNVKLPEIPQCKKKTRTSCCSFKNVTRSVGKFYNVFQNVPCCNSPVTYTTFSCQERGTPTPTVHEEVIYDDVRAHGGAPPAAPPLPQYQTIAVAPPAPPPPDMGKFKNLTSLCLVFFTSFCSSQVLSYSGYFYYRSFVFRFFSYLQKLK